MELVNNALLDNSYKIMLASHAKKNVLVVKIQLLIVKVVNQHTTWRIILAKIASPHAKLVNQLQLVYLAFWDNIT